MYEISVIICSHNPRVDFLLRTLDSLRQQTLSLQNWELLLVDNASSQSLAELMGPFMAPACKTYRRTATRSGGSTPTGYAQVGFRPVPLRR